MGEDGILCVYNFGDVYVGFFDVSGGDGVLGSFDVEFIFLEFKRVLV